MTHYGPMAESEGEFTTDTQETRPCQSCLCDTLHREQRWESNCGGYEDHKYTCLTCGKVHWVDGPDS